MEFGSLSAWSVSGKGVVGAFSGSDAMETGTPKAYRKIQRRGLHAWRTRESSAYQRLDQSLTSHTVRRIAAIKTVYVNADHLYRDITNVGTIQVT